MVQYGTLIFYGTVYFSLYYLLWYSAVLFVMSGLPLQVSLPLKVRLTGVGEDRIQDTITIVSCESYWPCPFFKTL